MEKLRININGKELTGFAGQTILEVARENGIFIPTLCYDERTKIYGSCGICMTEVEGNNKLCKACATAIAPGMVVKTNTERVIESRKTNLELLLSNHAGDCRPPCVKACPAQTDCQGYVGLIANGEYEEANKLVKDKIPLPASLGRVCPHPCEADCRRGLIDEPISIQMLKRFVADQDLESENSFIPECEPDTGKSVAIIGGGPMGLSAASFLRQKGHEVTIYEAMPKAGGMLRYGIPEYRLPKDVLDAEIALIEASGVQIRTNFKIGEDISFEEIRRVYDAVLLGIGAWVSTGVGCKGEDADGVIGGIDFLRKVVRNETIELGKKVAIVGGGNTAMDACRTAVRLGADEVFNVYRRTKDEMPADLIEIEEAEEEGVIFKNLTNPLEIIKDENGHVKEMVLQVMELGEPDESGRRRPVPVEGKTETIEVDTVILAIGQAVDSSLFDVEKTRKNGIAYDPETYMTSIPGVFAGGDCGNDKISIAVEAIADARKAADIMDMYLKGHSVKYVKPYYVERDDITEETFEDRERLFRVSVPQLSAEERKDNFAEVIPEGFSPEDAEKEADRCLQCGCQLYYECKLLDLANQYNVEPERFKGDMDKKEIDDDHPFILRDQNKCILCGLCVRVCDEVMGIGALGLVNRGFDTVVEPNMHKPLAESGCTSCGQCVACCPTGALKVKTTMVKETPVKCDHTDTICAFCSVGCSFDYMSIGDTLVKADAKMDGPVNAGLSCGKGKFGFDCAVLEDKLEEPLEKRNGNFEEIDYKDALIKIAKKCQAVGTRYGKDAIAVTVSDRFTNEEAYAVKIMADAMGAKLLCLDNRKSGIKPVLGFDASPNTIDELISTDVILVCGFERSLNPVIANKMRMATEAGARVFLVNPEDYPQTMNFVEEEHYTDNSLSFIKAMVAEAVKMNPECDIPGIEELKASLAGIEISDEIKSMTDVYINAKRAMIVFDQNLISTEAATLLADLAMVSGHIGNPRDGILQLKAKNNSQGLVDLGITAGAEELEGVKALLVFGEEADIDTDKLEFLAVCDTHMTRLASKADIVIPGTGSVSTDGTFTNTERRMQLVKAVIDEGIELSNWQIASEIAHIFEVDSEWESTEDISAEMNYEVDSYKYAEIGEILGGVLEPTDEATLVPVVNGVFADQIPCTDAHMNSISERLPKAVSPTL